MKVISLDKGSEFLKTLPAPMKEMNDQAKYHYRRIGSVLISQEKLKRIHLAALEIFAVNYAQWEWAITEIERKNKNSHGTGYIQTYTSGAKNLSVEVTLKRDAEKAMMQSIKQFGLDPKSEKELAGAIDPNQGDLFEQFNSRKQG